MQAQLELGNVDGHSLALIASGVCRADAYYCGSYEGGAVFFLIRQTPLRDPKPTAPELANVMSSVIANFPVDHKLMAQALLRQGGATLSESENELVASLPTSEIVVGFDNLHRIKNVRVTETPATSSQKSWWRFGG